MNRRRFLASLLAIPALMKALPLPVEPPSLVFRNIRIDTACYANRIYFLNPKTLHIVRLDMTAFYHDGCHVYEVYKCA